MMQNPTFNIQTTAVLMIDQGARMTESVGNNANLNDFGTTVI
jgi:hypothetical protein